MELRNGRVVSARENLSRPQDELMSEPGSFVRSLSLREVCEIEDLERRARLLQCEALRRRNELGNQILRGGAANSECSSTSAGRAKQVEDFQSCSYTPIPAPRRCLVSSLASPVPTPRRNRPEPQPAPRREPTEAVVRPYEGQGNDPITSLNYFVARQSDGKDLPKFRGEPREYPIFISQFKRTTRLCGYSNEENLGRLQKCLQGQAREAVYALLALPDSVPQILRVLECRFGRPEYVIGELGGRLKSMPEVRENDFASIMKFASEVQNYVTSVSILECDDYLIEPSMVKCLVAKLPPSIRLKWGEYLWATNKFSSPRINDLAEWVQQRAEAMSYILYDSPSQKPVEAADESREVKNRAPSWMFCSSGGHKVPECRKWSEESVSNRWAWAEKERVCYRCLKARHPSFRCNTPDDCKKCRGRHHVTLHRTTVKAMEKPTLESNSNQLHEIETEDEEKVSQEEAQHAHLEGTTGDWRAVLKVLPVRLYGPKGPVDTYALLDDASSITMLEHSLAKKLGLKGVKRPLSLAWTGEMSRFEANSEQVDLQISKCEINAKKYTLNKVRTVEKLGLKPQNIDIKQIAKRWRFVLKGSVMSLENAEPKIIIGQDNWPLLASRKALYGPWNGPVLSKTWLGWVLHGKLPQREVEGTGIEVSHSHFAHWEEEVKDKEQEDDDLNLKDLVRKHLALDEVGATQAKEIAQDDAKALAIFNATTKRIEGGSGRWETGLLWKEGFETLPESRRMALRRLYSLEKKLDQDPQMGARYCVKMQEYFDKNYARVMNDDEANVETPKTWYLPHIGVINPNKPAKLRVCFDASAKSNGYCLNDFLLKGPDLYKSIPGLLLKFRRWPVAVTADIKEMFPQIKIRKEDQDAQRFLWRGMDRLKPPQVCVMTSMIFGSICSPFSAQEVRSRNALEFLDRHPEAALAITERHYMDDYVESIHTESAAIKLVESVIEVHKKGGFEICGWASNSPVVMRKIPEHLRGECDQDGHCGAVKVLGMVWNTQLDQFVMQDLCKRWVERCQREGVLTRRRVLRAVMSVYDPIGLLTYITIQGRILAQEICKEKAGWDDPISDNLKPDWQRWVKALKSVRNLTIPRQVSPLLAKTGVTSQLHIFCDASARAYAAVAYLRVEAEGQIETSYMYSRARVAPVEQRSIPRLVLQAAVMAAQMGKFLQDESGVGFEETVYWTDSQVVLHWLNTAERRLKVFVGNRVDQILKCSKVQQWRWVPGEVNVADLATKEGSHQTEAQWWRGPAFLGESSDEWPQEIKLGNPSIEMREGIDQALFVGVILSPNTMTRELPDIERFGEYLKLVRATAWVLRLKWNARQKKRKCELLPSEIEAAQILWCHKVQEDSFPEELEILKKGKMLTKKSKLYHLSPVLEHNSGIICVKGRLEQAGDMGFWSNQPIILEQRYRFTRLLITYYHERVGHTGQETVLNELRQKFWILQARKAVQRAWSQCLWCRSRKSKPLQAVMGNLPKERLVHHIHPFTNVGVDYFGPMEVTVGRRREKRYGALFTCLSTRAIHLEVVNSLSSDGMIMALRRFSSRRGWPQKIFPDNGTNFKGAANELTRSLGEWNQDSISSRLANHGVEWHFNPPLAPHMGGVWERLVRSVKCTMESILRDQHPRDEVLTTVFAEVEACVNSRPLTHVSPDPMDEEALTPNHFLIGRSSVAPVIPLQPEELCLKKAWRTAQQIADRFWERWVKEYRPTLLRKAKWAGARGNLQVGDMVLIVDPQGRRSTWPKGVVEALYPGKDGVTRVVDVRTSTGTYRRHITKLCPLAAPEDVPDSPSVIN